MRPLSEKSDAELVDKMFNELIPAWIGSSIGGVIALGSVFWRVVVFPPRLVIEYGDGSQVWEFQGELIRGARPEFDGSPTFICLALVALGLAIHFIASSDWRAARDELRRRRSALEAIGKKDG